MHKGGAHHHVMADQHGSAERLVKMLERWSRETGRSLRWTHWERELRHRLCADKGEFAYGASYDKTRSPEEVCHQKQAMGGIMGYEGATARILPDGGTDQCGGSGRPATTNIAR